MKIEEVWLITYLVVIGRGSNHSDAKDAAYQAIEDYEEFVKDTA